MKYLADKLKIIEQRNAIRAHALLPQLPSVAAEARKMFQVEREQAFQTWCDESGRRAEVLQQVLARRGLVGKKLSWMIGVSVGNEVRTILWKRFKERQRSS